MSGSSILALVPMRHTSERVVGKNYRDLGDRPLFTHIVDTLLECPSVHRVLIDTDSPAIRKASESRYGTGVVCVDRPEHLRDPATSMNDVLLHRIDSVDADTILQTHSTNPFLTSSTIEAAIATYTSRPSFNDALFTVTRLQTRLYWSDGSPVNHDPSELIRTQDLEPVLEENSCLYLFSKETLVSTGRRTGNTPIMFEIPRREALDIDDEDDFLIAEALYNHKVVSS